LTQQDSPGTEPDDRYGGNYHLAMFDFIFFSDEHGGRSMEGNRAGSVGGNGNTDPVLDSQSFSLHGISEG
jgi:hypothetical protein